MYESLIRYPDHHDVHGPATLHVCTPTRWPSHRNPTSVGRPVEPAAVVRQRPARTAPACARRRTPRGKPRRAGLHHLPPAPHPPAERHVIDGSAGFTCSPPNARPSCPARTPRTSGLSLWNIRQNRSAIISEKSSADPSAVRFGTTAAQSTGPARKGSRSRAAACAQPSNGPGLVDFAFELAAQRNHQSGCAPRLRKLGGFPRAASLQLPDFVFLQIVDLRPAPPAPRPARPSARGQRQRLHRTRRAECLRWLDLLPDVVQHEQVDTHAAPLDAQRQLQDGPCVVVDFTSSWLGFSPNWPKPAPPRNAGREC